MSHPKYLKAKVFEGSPCTLYARVEGGAAGTPITQATISAITYIVDQYDSEREAERDQNPTSISIEGSAGSVSSIVFDTLQTWDVDDEGYNVAFTVPASKFPEGDKYNVVELWFDPTSGDDFCQPWIVEVMKSRKD